MVAIQSVRLLLMRVVEVKVCSAECVRCSLRYTRPYVLYVVQVVATLPVLSSDDDSDDDNSQSSGDERKGDRRRSPQSVTDEGAALTPDPQGCVPAKDSEGRASSTPLPQGQEVMFTTTDFYLVLRMHHLLAERLAEAKKLCSEAGLSRQTVVASPQEVGGLY